MTTMGRKYWAIAEGFIPDSRREHRAGSVHDEP